jgi:hypothetical protein
LREAVTRLLIEKRIFTKEELFEMVRVVDREMKRAWLSIAVKGFEE